MAVTFLVSAPVLLNVPEEVRDSLHTNAPAAHSTCLEETFSSKLDVHIAKAADRDYREDFARRSTVNSPRRNQDCLMEVIDLERETSQTPLQVRRNMSFLVDISKLKSWQDVKSDINGVYPVTLQVAKWTVEVGANNHVEIMEKQQLELANNNDYHVMSTQKRTKQVSVILYFSSWTGTRELLFLPVCCSTH